MSIRKRIGSTSSLKVLRFCVSYDAQRVMFAIAQFLVLVVVWQRGCYIAVISGLLPRQ